MFIIGGVILMGIVMMKVYLPVFHDLKLTSTYQVLKLKYYIERNNQIFILFSIYKPDLIKRCDFSVQFCSHLER